MADQFLLVPDRNDLKQVHGSLLIGRRMDGTLIPVLIDDDGVLLLASGPGNDYSDMAEVYRLVPDRNLLKQVHGSLLVGNDNGTLLPVAVDDNGRIIASGGGAGGAKQVFGGHGPPSGLQTGQDATLWATYYDKDEGYLAYPWDPDLGVWIGP